jgi:PKD repeat protein
MQKLFFILSLLVCSLAVQAQCPNCTVTLPSMPVDTVYLDTFPVARQNQPYAEQLSFRLPMTTTPLVALQPGVPPNFNLSGFTVQGISGLPIGMSFQLDKPLPAVYNSVNPIPRDGCVSICGTPRQAGTFTVQISISVETGAFPPQPATIPLSFLVLPDTSAGFSISNGTGCSPLIVNFTNNVVPDSTVGQTATYFWDFGNGTTSTLANPPAVTYTDTGVINVNYRAIVTTTQNKVYLSSVVIDSVGCGDLLISPNPELFIDVNKILPINPTNPIFTFPSGGLGNIPTSSLPQTFTLGANVQLDTNSVYEIQVKDDDAIFQGLPAPENCGTVSFPANTTQDTVILTSGSLGLKVILSRVTLTQRDTVNTTDIVVVNGCNSSSSQIEFIEGTFKVYPNPTSGLLQFSFESSDLIEEQVEIQLIDMLGRNLFTEQIGSYMDSYQGNLDMGQYGTGIYLLQLQIGNALINKRIIVR